MPLDQDLNGPSPNLMPSDTIEPAALPLDYESLNQEKLNRGNWERLQELYHLLEATPETEREAVLLAAGADRALRAHVLSLLSSSDELSVTQPSEDLPGVSQARVGPYTLLRHLGSGGLGSVYLSQRTVGGVVQRCALKVLMMYSVEPAFRERFQREQQILATLDHPNITRLLDAGLSDTNQPYLVMEFVDGLNLTTFCNEQRLSIPQRLALFLDICDAVIYAHRNLVVHLDLKPSNVLVTRDGTVKLLDFGTSKLIGPENTMATTVLATPAYASPEQMRGEPVTTACDVYSLGAMLYESLSGRRPFETASIAMAMYRASSGQEPSRITTAVTEAGAEARGIPAPRLRRMLDGDLAAIVARCLRSRPQDRYSSVDALAGDLRRHLEGRPVLARRQTLTYLGARFVRRKAWPVAISTIALLLFLVVGSYAYVRQTQALQQGRRAQQMETFLSQLFKLANQNYTGKPAATVPEFLQLGVKVLPDFIKDPADRRSAQLSLGESMFDSQDYQHALPVLQDVVAGAKSAGDFKVEAEAEAFGGMAASTLGKTALADEMTEHALTLARARGVDAATRIWVEGYYALTHAIRSFDSARSISLLRAAVAESRSAGVPERERLWVLEKLALVDQTSGDLDTATKLAQEAYTIVLKEPYALCDRSAILELQANLLSLRGDDEGSLPVYRQAVATSAECSGPGSIYTLTIQDLLARAMLNVGQTKETIALLEASMPAWRKVAAGSQNLSIPLIFLARAYVMNGDFDQGGLTAREALQIQEGKVNNNSTRVAMCHLLIAQSLTGEHRYRAALAEAEVTKDIYATVPNMSRVEKMYQEQALALLARLHEEKGTTSQH